MTLTFGVGNGETIFYAFTHPGFSIVRGNGAGSNLLVNEGNVNFDYTFLPAEQALLDGTTTSFNTDFIQMNFPNSGAVLSLDASKLLYRRVLETDNVMDQFVIESANPANYFFLTNGIGVEETTNLNIRKGTGSNLLVLQSEITDSAGVDLSPGGPTDDGTNVITTVLANRVRFNSVSQSFNVTEQVFNAVLASQTTLNDSLLTSVTTEFDANNPDN